jgi:hypothetical protein
MPVALFQHLIMFLLTPKQLFNFSEWTDLCSLLYFFGSSQANPSATQCGVCGLAVELNLNVIVHHFSPEVQEDDFMLFQNGIECSVFEVLFCCRSFDCVYKDF